MRELKNLKHTESSSRLNYLLIPVSTFDINEEGAKKFNKIYCWLKQQGLYELQRTASGGIKTGPHMKVPAWDVRKNKYCVEITVILEGCAWRIQFRTGCPNNMSGRKVNTNL